MKTGFIRSKKALLRNETPISQAPIERGSAVYQIGIIAAAVLLVVSAAFL